MRSGEDGLPDTEGGEAHYLPEHERARTEDDCLRRQDGSPLRDSGERGSDHAAAVRGADHEDAERADRDLGQVDAAEAGQSGVEIAELSGPSSETSLERGYGGPVHGCPADN